MLDYNIFLHTKPGSCRYMPHFNVFVTGPVMTGLDRFFAVLVCGPWFLKLSGTKPVHGLSPEGPRTGTGLDLEALSRTLAGPQNTKLSTLKHVIGVHRQYREWYNFRKVPSLLESEWKNICLECLSVFGHFFLASKSTVNGSYPPHSYSKESELHQKNYLIENMKTVQESTMCHKF